MAETTITPLVMGDYLAPDGRNAGSRILIVAYLVKTAGGTILFDSGFPWDGATVFNEGDLGIETFPRSLIEALDRVGSSLGKIDAVANCHLHVDHGGGNFRLGELPIFIQRAEFEAARDPDHSIDWAVALDTANYKVVEGERQIAPGVAVVPTPGHTNGHQSLIVETGDGSVVLLGQAAPSASDFALIAYHAQLESEGDKRHPPLPEWWSRIARAQPVEVRFAHDLAVWRAAG
jgi:glyoxylase-like metal-dependent hydrolase (beta-lactamase superfamily II)